MYDLQIVRSEAAEIAKQMRTRIRKAAIGRSYKAAEAPGGAYVGQAVDAALHDSRPFRTNDLV